MRPYLPPSWLFTTLVTFFVARDKDKFPRPILEHIVKSFRLVSGGGRALVRRDKREKEGGEGRKRRAKRENFLWPIQEESLSSTDPLSLPLSIPFLRVPRQSP